MPACLNLQERFGDRYRIDFDPAYEPKGRKHLDLWMMLIPCRYGTIYPAGGDRLRVDIDYHNHLAHRVAVLPGCTLVQDGDQEKTIEFSVTLFPVVAEIVRPLRRRQQATSVERERLAKIGLSTRFAIQVNAALKSTSQSKNAS